MQLSFFGLWGQVAVIFRCHLKKLPSLDAHGKWILLLHNWGHMDCHITDSAACLFGLSLALGLFLALSFATTAGVGLSCLYAALGPHSSLDAWQPQANGATTLILPGFGNCCHWLVYGALLAWISCWYSTAGLRALAKHSTKSLLWIHKIIVP